MDEILNLIESVSEGFPSYFYSDHNSLTFIHKMKNKNQRILKWSLLLQVYDLDIRHTKRKDNIISDALSREGMKTLRN